MTITAEMLAPVTSAVTSGITAIVPVGITILGAMLGVRMIPRIVHMFF